MKFNTIFKFFIALAISLSAGAGAIFTTPAIQSGWYATLAKPALNPPNWIFGPVWTTLYILIGVSLFIAWNRNWKVVNHPLQKVGKAWNPLSERLWKGDLQKINVIAIFAVQYILNILWSAVFFGLHRPDMAFLVIIALLVSIIYLIINFYRISKTAAWLLVPYLFWVSFATYLNFSIWLLNL